MRMLTLILCGVCQAAFAMDGPPSLSDLTAGESYRLGIEALTGYRSHYIYRGERMGENTAEVQLATGIAVSNDWLANAEVFYARNWEHNNFWQTSLRGELLYYLTDECTAGALLGCQWFEGAAFRNGLEMGGAVHWNPSLDWALSGAVSYDTGQTGMMAECAVCWQPLICERVAMVNKVSAGFAYEYLGHNGLKELMFRTGLRWAVTENLRLEPFVGYYCGFGKEEFHKPVIGAWVSYSF